MQKLIGFEQHLLNSICSLYFRFWNKNSYDFEGKYSNSAEGPDVKCHIHNFMLALSIL